MSIENNSTIEQSRNMPKGDAQSVPKGWVESTLGEVGRVVTGKTPSKNNPDDWGDKYDFITPSEIGGNNKYIYNTPRKLSDIGFERFSRMILPENSIIVTCIGSDMGKVVLNKYKALTNQQINSIIVNEDNYFDFIYYLLKNAYRILRRNAEGSGSTMPILNKGNFENLSFTIPKSLEEQKAIAQILTAFDDKIELLQAQNKTLETTAQTIFKEWFGKYKIGDELPEGWRVGRLGEEFNITIGRTPPRKEKEWFSNTPIGKKWISIKDIGNSGAYISNTAEYLTNKAIERFNIPIIPKNTTILSFKMTVGKLTITTEDMLSNEAIAHLKLKQNTVLSSEFIYLYLQDLDFNALGSTSSIVTAINSTMIKYLEFLMPEKNILLQFDELIKPIFDKIYNNTTQIQTLKQTRDTLLPKLMSGQLRVDEFKERAV